MGTTARRITEAIRLEGIDGLSPKDTGRLVDAVRPCVEGARVGEGGDTIASILQRGGVRWRNLDDWSAYFTAAGRGFPGMWRDLVRNDGEPQPDIPADLPAPLRVLGFLPLQRLRDAAAAGGLKVKSKPRADVLKRIAEAMPPTDVRALMEEGEATRAQSIESARAARPKLIGSLLEHTLVMWTHRLRDFESLSSLGAPRVRVSACGDEGDCFVCRERNGVLVDARSPPPRSLPLFHPGCRCGWGVEFDF